MEKSDSNEKPLTDPPAGDEARGSVVGMSPQTRREREAPFGHAEWLARIVARAFVLASLAQLLSVVAIVQGPELFLPATMLWFVLSLGAGLLWVVWFWRSWSNLWLLGAGDQPLGRSWGLLGTIVPCLNIVSPFLYWRLWRASAPLEPGCRCWRDVGWTDSGLAVVLGYPLLSIVAGAASNRLTSTFIRAARSRWRGELEFDVTADAWIGLAAGVAANVAAWLYVTRIAARQRARLDQLLHDEQASSSVAVGIGTPVVPEPVAAVAKALPSGRKWRAVGVVVAVGLCGGLALAATRWLAHRPDQLQSVPLTLKVSTSPPVIEQALAPFPRVVPAVPAWGGPESATLREATVILRAGTTQVLLDPAGLVAVGPSGIVVHGAAGERAVPLPGAMRDVVLSAGRAVVSFDDRTTLSIVDLSDVTTPATLEMGWPGAALAVDAREPRRLFVWGDNEVVTVDVGASPPAILRRTSAPGRATACVAAWPLVYSAPSGGAVIDARTGRPARTALQVELGVGTGFLAQGRLYHSNGWVTHVGGGRRQAVRLKEVAGCYPPRLVGDLPNGILLSASERPQEGARKATCVLAFHDPVTFERHAVDPEELPWEGTGQLAIVPGTNRLVLLPFAPGAPLRADAAPRYRDLKPPALPATSPPQLAGEPVDLAHPLEAWEQPLRFVQSAPLAGAVPLSPPDVIWDAGAGVLRWTPSLEQVGPQTVKVTLQRAGLPDLILELPVNVAYREVGLDGDWRARRLPDGKVMAVERSVGAGSLSEPCVVVLDPTAGRSSARLPAGVVEYCWVGTTLWLVLARDTPELLSFDAPSLTPRRWPLVGKVETRPSRLAAHPSGQLTWVGQVEDEWRLYLLDPATSSLRSAPFAEPRAPLEWRSATGLVCGGNGYAWEDGALTNLDHLPAADPSSGRMIARIAPGRGGLIAHVYGPDGAERGWVLYPDLDPAAYEEVTLGEADRTLLLSARSVGDSSARLLALPFDPAALRRR